MDCRVVSNDEGAALYKAEVYTERILHSRPCLLHRWVDFKKDVYRRVAKEFGPIIKRRRARSTSAGGAASTEDGGVYNLFMC